MMGRVTVTRIEDDAQSVGSLRSRQGVMLRPEVSGRIARIGFRDGQRVKRGELLVQLDDTLQRAQLQQSQAQASIARTTCSATGDCWRRTSSARAPSTRVPRRWR